MRSQQTDKIKMRKKEEGRLKWNSIRFFPSSECCFFSCLVLTSNIQNYSESKKKKKEKRRENKLIRMIYLLFYFSFCFVYSIGRDNTLFLSFSRKKKKKTIVFIYFSHPSLRFYFRTMINFELKNYKRIDDKTAE